MSNWLQANSCNQESGRMPRITLTADQFNKNFYSVESDKSHFVAESSDLQMRPRAYAHCIDIIDLPPGRTTVFQLTTRDMNGDDIAGWNYQEIGGDKRLLIIND